jgi:hypothetical protein
MAPLDASFFRLLRTGYMPLSKPEDHSAIGWILEHEYADPATCHADLLKLFAWVPTELFLVENAGTAPLCVLAQSIICPEIWWWISWIHGSHINVWFDVLMESSQAVCRVRLWDDSKALFCWSRFSVKNDSISRRT